MKIGIIGYGKMGRALALSMKRTKSQYEIKTTTTKNENDNEYIIQWADIIFITLKPKDWTNVMTKFLKYFKPDQLIISFMATITLSNLMTTFPPRQPLIRCVSNIPIEVGAGSLVLKANDCVTDTNKQTLTNLIIGPKFHWLDDESLFNAITVLIGCGPAFLAQIYQDFYEASCALHIPPDLSTNLLSETLIGTTKLIEHEKSFTDIILSVKSKGGLTESGLNMYKSKSISESIQSVFSSALSS